MARNTTGRGSDQFPLRLPDGMRERLKLAAERSGLSMNQEIVTRLDASLGRDEGAQEFTIWLPEDLLDRVLHAAEGEETDPNVLIVDAIETKYPPRTPTFGDLVAALKREIPSSIHADERAIAEAEEYLRAAEALLKVKPHFANRAITPDSLVTRKNPFAHLKPGEGSKK